MTYRQPSTMRSCPISRAIMCASIGTCVGKLRKAGIAVGSGGSLVGVGVGSVRQATSASGENRYGEAQTGGHEALPDLAFLLPFITYTHIRSRPPAWFL